MSDPNIEKSLRLAEINVQRARVAISILRQLNQALPATEQNQELLEEIVALGRTLRRTIMMWQRQYAGDPLVAHVFEARKQFLRAQDHSTKSGKSIQRTIQSTFVKAERLGFTGSFDDWERLLMISAAKGNLRQTYGEKA